MLLLRHLFLILKGLMMSNKDSRTRNSVRNLISSFGSQFFLVFIKFACRTVFINTLGKSYLGINGLFSDILTMLSLTELGLDTAINYKLYKPLADNDVPRVRVLMKFYRYAYYVVGLVILVLGFCLIPVIPYLIKDYEKIQILGINATVVFLLYLAQSVTSYLFFASYSAIIKADQKDYIVYITNFISTLIMNIFQMIVLIVWRNFILYVALNVIFNIVQNCVNAYIARKNYPEVFTKTSEKLSVSEVKDMFKDLGALFITKINGVVLKATDNLVLSAFVGLAMVGTYSNYLMFYTTIKSLLFKVYGSTKASMGNLFATETDEKKYAFFELMNFLTILLYGTAAVGVAVEANELIECWIGADYIIPQPFSILMAIEILFLGIRNNLNQIRNVSGLFRQMWFRPMLGIIVNLGTSVILVQFIGIYGVLIGTIMADVLTNFIIDPPIIHKYGLNNIKPVSSYYARNLRYFIILVLVGVFDFAVCGNLFVGHGWLSVAVHVTACAISVPVTVCAVFYKGHEAQYLFGAAKRIIKRFNRRSV